MIVLGIETSGRRGSVALVRNEQVLASRRSPEGASHARDVMPAIDQLLRNADIRKEEVNGVTVSEGPGSFTGLRIGITCAKTLAYLLHWEAAAVPSLEVLVENVNPDVIGVQTACPLRDARRSTVYGTLFRREGDAWEAQTGVMVKSPKEMASQLPPDTLVFGSGARAYPETFGPDNEHGLLTPERDMEEGRAEAVARLGARLIARGETTPPMQLEPRYYRRTAAEERANSPDRDS